MEVGGCLQKSWRWQRREHLEAAGSNPCSLWGLEEGKGAESAGEAIPSGESGFYGNKVRVTETLAGPAYMGGQSENTEGHEEKLGSTHSSSGWTSKSTPERQGPLESLKQVGGEDHGDWNECSVPSSSLVMPHNP